MNNKLALAVALASFTFAGQAAAQLVIYGQDRFGGQSFTSNEDVVNLKRHGFNDRASSAIVLRGRWEVCDNIRFRGNCVVLRPGRYPSFGAMGLNDRISSVRVVQADAQYDDNRYAPPPERVYNNYRRNEERLFEAQVVSVRAVLTQDNRQCWIEREQVGGQYRDSGKNVPGAIVGAVIGGILGHQVGGGKGRDYATAAGVIVGATAGANTNSNGRRGYTQNVQRCSGRYGGNEPQYWDVIYTFRGQEHRMQTSYPPGPTITVNRNGQPRA